VLAAAILDRLFDDAEVRPIDGRSLGSTARLERTDR